MTLVCVRVDESYSTPRLTALADTRATVPGTDGSQITLTDTTVKLFAIPVRCYTPDTLTPVIGAWCDPYYETMIGLGFSGNCLEALTVVAHVTQSLGALVATTGDPLPCKEGLVNLIAKTTESFFDNHSGQGNPILQMIVFGFDHDRPWIGKVSWDSKQKLKSEVDWADANALVSIGDSADFERHAREWQRRIENHKARVAARPGESSDADTAFERAKGVNLHDVASKKLRRRHLRKLSRNSWRGLAVCCNVLSLD
jgi:hypothetical protein